MDPDYGVRAVEDSGRHTFICREALTLLYYEECGWLRMNDSELDTGESPDVVSMPGLQRP